MLVDIRKLEARIGDRPILRDVSLSLDRGEIYGLLGPNGAGKTTTIFAALGVLPRSGGFVRILGRDPAQDGEAIRQDIGVLPDPNGFYDWMTAGAYLAFFAGLYGVRLELPEIRQRLDRVGLAPRRGQPIGTFSRGMRQRLGLARALLADPALLVLDEPTNGLDPRGRRDIHEVLLHLAREDGVGILLCTHLLDDVERLCSKVGFIVEGRTVMEGEIAGLLRTREHFERFRLRLSAPAPANPTLPRLTRVVACEGQSVVIDVDPSIAPEEAWRELMFRGWPIVEIARAGGSIEDLYLDLTEGRVQ
ncbi:MAG: ABC transporter ATP-binding protein [Pseudomonadota bacterium]